MLTERTIERFSQTSTVDDGKRSGRPRGVQTNTAIKAVRERILRNPFRKQKI